MHLKGGEVWRYRNEFRCKLAKFSFFLQTDISELFCLCEVEVEEAQWQRPHSLVTK
jgi:hypothetical protein